MTQSLTILGSTGSIGTSTLDVVARHPERYRIFALSGHSQTAKLAEQCLAFRPQYAVTANEAQAAELHALLAAAGCQTEVLHGEQALCDIAAAPETDGVMAGKSAKSVCRKGPPEAVRMMDCTPLCFR